MNKMVASMGIGLALAVATMFTPTDVYAGRWHGRGWHGGHGWGWGGVGLGLGLAGIGIAIGPRYAYGGYPYYDDYAYGYGGYPYYRSYYYGAPYHYGYGRPYYGTYWGHNRRVARRVYRRHNRWD
jgi:hypothetical protein